MVWCRTGGVLTVKKIFLIFIVLMMTLMISIVSAEEIDSDTLVNDMRNNPKNYVYVGNASSAGDSIFAMKSSVDVKEYKPPKYIIEIKLAQIWWKEGMPSRTKDSANLLWEGKPLGFIYDYNSKKIYCEHKDNDLEYLDKENANRGKFNSMMMSSAELAFYWAYDMSFYDKPVSHLFQRYIEEGIGTFDNREF